MKINYNSNSTFPEQVVPIEEKMSLEYGKQVADAIQSEWFAQGRTNGNRYLTSFNSFHNRRLYARGEQPVQKYKDELSINGDLSYLNLDWKPVPILSKFVDILTNGISAKDYDIKAYAQDPESIKKRTKYAEGLAKDMFAYEIQEQVKASTGVDISNTKIPKENLPKTIEEMELHLQLSYKQSIEIAEEEAISQVLAQNKFELLKRRINLDLVTLGIAAAKTSFNPSNGITLDYVDPAYMIYSYTEDPNFEDVYYVGEVKAMTIPEVKKHFPHISNEELEKLQKYNSNNNYIYGYFTQDGEVYKIYQPKSKRRFFKVKSHIQGLDQLKYNQPYLVICSSLKDAICLKSFGYNIEVIAPDSENTMIKPYIIENLKNKYKKCITLFDNDDAGYKAIKRYNEVYQIKGTSLQLSKDISDAISQFDFKTVHQELKPLLKEALK